MPSGSFGLEIPDRVMNKLARKAVKQIGQPNGCPIIAFNLLCFNKIVY